MQRKNKIYLILLLCVLTLIVLCITSVSAPLRFEKQRAEREGIVMQRMETIMKAEKKYKAAHGTYAPDLRALIADKLLADSSTVIPFSEGETFSIEASVNKEPSGRETCTIECGAQYQQYLKGLDDNNIALLIEEANNSGRYPGLCLTLNFEI